MIALCCGVAALVLVIRASRREGTPDTSGLGETGASAADGSVRDQRGAAGAPGRPRVQAARGTGANAPAGTAHGPTRLGETTEGHRGAPLRRRPPPAVAAGGLALREGSERVLEAPRHRPDLPPAGRSSLQIPAEATDDSVPEAIPDIAYDGGADHVFDTGSQTEVSDAGKISGEAGTIAFWIEPGWERNSQEAASFVQLGDNGLRIIKNGNSLRFEYTDSAGNVHGGGADIGDWQAGDWRHVTASWTGSTLSLYVDGGQVFLNHAPPLPDFGSETKLYVGSASPHGAPVAVGQISYLTVLNREVSGDEVRRMFESGGPPPQ